MNDSERYHDIIRCTRPQSERHPPMPMRERAAQFSPFAALSGYAAAIRETERLTEPRIDADDETRRRLSEQLTLLAEKADSHPDLTVTFFAPDPQKAGGHYRTCTGALKEIDTVLRRLVLGDMQKIPFDDILALESPLFLGISFD